MNVIGIDLGTTNCSVGRLASSLPPQLIPDYGKIAIPSVVAYQWDPDEGREEWQVGKLAAARAPKYPKTTIFDTKRMLGCSFDMEAIQKMRSS
jgi:molecular chaperone DnaK (HSP70)